MAQDKTVQISHGLVQAFDGLLETAQTCMDEGWRAEITGQKLDAAKDLLSYAESHMLMPRDLIHQREREYTKLRETYTDTL